MIEIKFETPATGIFTPDTPTDKPEIIIPDAPIMNYAGCLRPDRCNEAKELGRKCVDEVKANIIADFEKNETYCEKHPGEHVDMMVHVSTFAIKNGFIYMTYYANTGTAAEDPSMQEARFAICPENDPSDMTIIRLQKVGDLIDGKKIDRVYDTILMEKSDDLLYLMWTASADGLYYRFYTTYTISTATVGQIRPNRFKVGDVTNDFSTTGIVKALSANGLGHKVMFSDIGIMQKLSTRVENGETCYYTGAYSGYFNCIIKSADLITWEYVATPDFINLSLWENAVYVSGDKCWYFVRQEECMQGFLTCYDLEKKTWSTPTLIRDTQSRSDFIFYNNELYLIHAPENRDGFGIVKINREEQEKSEPIVVASMHESLFYPFARVYGEYVYMSYTIARKHIRLSRFRADEFLK